MKKIFLMVSLLAMSGLTYSACSVDGAKITSIHQYYDGTVFISFDKPNNCSCPFNTRMATQATDANSEFIKAMALSAYMANKTIDAGSNISGCPIHGNTAKMNYLLLK